MVAASRVLVGFINKPELVSDTDVYWHRAPPFSDVTSYKKQMFGDFFTYLSFRFPSLFYCPFPKCKDITLNFTGNVLDGKIQ